MTSSFRTIIDALREFASNHEQINSFGWGNPDNITTKDHLFPMLFAAPVPGSMGGGSFSSLKFDIYIIDLEAQDHSNLLTIMNETLLIGNDVVNRFFDEHDEDLFSFDGQVFVTPFEAKFDDHTAGWIMNVAVQVMLPNCNIPVHAPYPDGNIVIKGFLHEDVEEFKLETNGVNIQVTQENTTSLYPVSGETTCKAKSGSEVIITLDDTTTTFKFKNDVWESIDLVKLIDVTSLELSFNLKRLEKFSCSADSSRIENVNGAWNRCEDLSSFPLMDTSAVTDFGRAWSACRSLTSFPLLDTSNGTTFSQAWQYCEKLETFPKLNMDNATNMQSAWDRCMKLQTFPAINLPKATNFSSTWSHCHVLRDFPAIDVSAGENFYTTFAACHGIDSFPLLDFSSGKIFFQTFSYMENLVCFKSLDFSNLNHGHETFKGSDKLVQPAPTGTHVRKGVTGTKGKWTNNKDCPPVPTLVGRLLHGTTGFGVSTDDGLEFTVEHDGVIVTYTGLGIADRVNVSGLDHSHDVTIKFNHKTTAFSFKSSDAWKTLNIKELARVETLDESFWGLFNLETFECDADSSGLTSLYHTWDHCKKMSKFPQMDTSNVTKFHYTWDYCTELTTFPPLDFSSGLDFRSTWLGCQKLKCFVGPVNFTSLTNGFDTFSTCPVLTRPASTGTNIREGSTSTAGTWTNPKHCP